jgi:small-conductance mechanosensitive channel/CRP-like cAMP-binding protein
MAFWKDFEISVAIPPALLWSLVAFLLVGCFLYYYVRRERGHIRAALLFYGLSFAGILVSTEILRFGASESGLAYRCVNQIALILGGIAFVKLAAVFVFAVVLRPARLEPPPIAQDLLLALAYLTVGIIVLSHSGVDVRGIVATSAVLTAIIGFSLQDSLGNIMGGLVLQTEQTIRVGDWIRVDEIEGRVKLTRWRQTSIETRNWDTIVIPNAVLMKSKVTLLGRREGAPLQRRQWVYFRVDLTHSPTKVIHAVESSLHADTIRCIASDPRPHCLLTDFKEGDAVYAVRYWLNDLSQPDPTDSIVRTRIYGALSRAGINLAVPTQSVFLTEQDDHGRERRHNEEIHHRLTALRKQEFFQFLTEPELTALAPRMATARFLRGEAITRQGAEAHWLYIIADGDAAVDVAVDGKSQHVATLHAGEIFGEMGLMTGELRTATVNALTDVTCYRLGKEEFQDILTSRPEIAEQISLILAKRRVELDAVREQLGQAVRTERMRDMQGVLLRRIREFFALR